MSSGLYFFYEIYDFLVLHEFMDFSVFIFLLEPILERESLD